MFWIDGASVNVDRIQNGVNAAHRMCYDHGINPHKAWLANRAKKRGEPHNKQLAEAWKQARDECFNTVYGEPTSWERSAKFILR